MISQTVILLHYYRTKAEVFARAHPFIALSCVINALVIWPLLLIAALKLVALGVCIFVSVLLIVFAFSPLLLISLYSFITVITICTLFSWILIIAIKYVMSLDRNGSSGLLSSAIEPQAVRNGEGEFKQTPHNSLKESLREFGVPEGMIGRAKAANELLHCDPNELQNLYAASVKSV